MKHRALLGWCNAQRMQISECIVQCSRSRSVAHTPPLLQHLRVPVMSTTIIACYASRKFGVFSQLRFEYTSISKPVKAESWLITGHSRTKPAGLITGAVQPITT